MKIRNDGLPEPLYRVIEKLFARDREVEPNRYSITELNTPVKIVWLKRRHDSEITLDASDLLWRLWGVMLHKAVEVYDNPEALKEEKLAEKIGDCTVVGRMDLLTARKISDYKLTSVWTHIYASRIDEWTAAQNMYAWLFHKATFPVDGLEIIEVFKDWSKSKWEREKSNGYPWKVETVKLELWLPEKTEDLIRQRLQALTVSEALSDDEIPVCSKEDRWEDPTKYAVMKGENKRALRLLDSEEAAQKFIDAVTKDKDKLHIVVREGEPRRCYDYCECNQFCNFYKALPQKGEEV